MNLLFNMRKISRYLELSRTGHFKCTIENRHFLRVIATFSTKECDKYFYGIKNAIYFE